VIVRRSCFIALPLLAWTLDSVAEVATTVEEYATCAAYYFNATNVTPMSAFERVYGAGEYAFNQALQQSTRAAVDKLVGEASARMTRLMSKDWNNFDRVRARYAADCQALMGAAAP
jgi:hypothetical protein